MYYWILIGLVYTVCEYSDLDVYSIAGIVLLVGFVALPGSLIIERRTAENNKAESSWNSHGSVEAVCNGNVYLVQIVAKYPRL